MFCCTNRILGQGLLSWRSIIWLRRWPANLQEASIQAAWFWYTYRFFTVGSGFPFYVVRHPSRCQQTGRHLGFLGTQVHPALYWGFFSIYKIVWSSLQAVTVANWITDPFTQHSNSRLVPKNFTCPSWAQRERVLRLENLRYQGQLAGIRDDLNDEQNQKSIRALRIENRWVALGNTGAAIQDVIDEARDLNLLRPHQVISCFQNFARSLPLLEEVCISMSLSLPVLALGQLIEMAPNLKYIKLDGVALSVHNLENDLMEFSWQLHGMPSARCASNNNSDPNAAMQLAFGNDRSTNNCLRMPPSTPQPHPSSVTLSRRPSRLLPLETLIMEHCRLENDEPDPQMRTRYSMDLLLNPAILTALTPPTNLMLKHLTLWVKCQRISALELAAILSANTTLESLDLQLILDRSVEIEEEMDDHEEPHDWVVLPLAQTFQYNNRSLRRLRLQLATGLVEDGTSENALIRMMQANETLRSIDMWRSDTQRRIRITEVEFYLHLNNLNRRKYRQEDSISRSEWVAMLVQERNNVAVSFYMLSLNPSSLLGRVL